MPFARKHPAHCPPLERHNEPIIVFVTVCSKERKPIFAKDDVFELMKRAWSRATSWKVGRFIVMPDHIHLFCSPAEWLARPMDQWVRYWKSEASRAWPRPEEQPIWQPNYWDTQLRHGTHYGERWEYVQANPVRAGFVNGADEWPFQGEMHVLRW